MFSGNCTASRADCSSSLMYCWANLVRSSSSLKRYCFLYSLEMHATVCSDRNVYVSIMQVIPFAPGVEGISSSIGNHLSWTVQKVCQEILLWGQNQVESGLVTASKRKASSSTATDRLAWDGCIVFTLSSFQYLFLYSSGRLVYSQLTHLARHIL